MLLSAVWVTAAATLAVPCLGGHCPAHAAPAEALSLGCTQGCSKGDFMRRRFNSVHVFQHKPHLSVGESGVAQTCSVPCLEGIRRSALAFPE